MIFDFNPTKPKIVQSIEVLITFLISWPLVYAIKQSFRYNLFRSHQYYCSDLKLVFA